MPAAIRPLLLSAADVAHCAPPLADIIDVVEDTYRRDAAGEVEVPAKVALHPHGPSSFLHAMPAWVGGQQALGMKWVSFFPGNARHGAPDSSALIVLNDPLTGVPVAIMEGMWITYARTGACAALAAKYCANLTPRRVGLVGCGGLGEWSLRCLAAVFPSVAEVFVASQRPASRADFCARMADQGPWTMTPVDEVRQAVQDMDIVVSSVPKLQTHPIAARWWSPGTVLIPLDITGSWDDATYERADRVVCDHRDNLARAFERYRPGLAIDDARGVGMQDIVSGRALGRAAATDRVMAFMTGVGSIDVAVAWDIYRRADEQKRGQRFDLA